jgi:P-type Cu2+ transporter
MGSSRRTGWSKFYTLRDGKGQPVKPHVFEPRDFQWLQEMVDEREVQAGDEPCHLLVLDVQGITCLGCVWLMEKIFQSRPGAVAIEINAALGQVRMEWSAGSFDAPGFAREIQSYGYLLAPPGTKDGRESNLLVRKMGVCAALAGNCMMFTLPGYLGCRLISNTPGSLSFLAMVFATASMMARRRLFYSSGRPGPPARHGKHRSSHRHGDRLRLRGIALCLVARRPFIRLFRFRRDFYFLMLVGRWTHQRRWRKIAIT